MCLQGPGFPNLFYANEGNNLFTFIPVMKKLILLLLILLPGLLLLAQADSTGYRGLAGVGDVAEEDPGLFVFMMIFLLGLIVAILFALSGAGLLGLFIFLLTAGGILSVSVFMGWYKRSVYTGLKWFVYLSFCVAGMAGVTLVCLLLHRFEDTGYSLKTLLSWGLPAGLAGGLLAGWIVLAAGRAAYRRFFGTRDLQQL